MNSRLKVCFKAVKILAFGICLGVLIADIVCGKEARPGGAGFFIAIL
jgi:hypothetical protein